MPVQPVTVERSVQIAAPRLKVWELVSDLPGMGAYSPENTGGRWRRGATGPAVGAVFRGRNGRGLRRWSTTSTVTSCEPGRAFSFRVSFGGVGVAEWSYRLTAASADSAGCTLTETWRDGRSGLLRRLGPLATGVADREAFTATSIEQTLERVKARAETS